MDEITERDSTYTFNREYWHDDLPTRATSAQDEAKYRNGVQYDMLLDYLIHQDAPIIAVFAKISRMLLDGISVGAGQHFGRLAQQIYDLERGIIERKAGIK